MNHQTANQDDVPGGNREQRAGIGNWADELAELQNPDNWEDIPDGVRPPVESPRAVIPVAFTADEIGRIERAARRQSLKITAFIRSAALTASEEADVS